jgi:hypothetical protein
MSAERDRQAELNARIEKLTREAKGLRPGAQPELSELQNRVTPDQIAEHEMSRELLAKCVVQNKFTVTCPECWGVGWFLDADGNPTVACSECGGAARITIVIQKPQRAPMKRVDRILFYVAAAIAAVATVGICLR